MIKEARGLLYCDGLASSRLVVLVVGGGEKGREEAGGSALSLGDFVHLQRRRKNRGPVCVRIHLSRFLLFCFHRLAEPRLWGVLCVRTEVYVNIQHWLACKDLLRSVLMTEHLKTPICPEYSSSSSSSFPPMLLFLEFLFVHTHPHAHTLWNTHIGLQL